MHESLPERRVAATCSTETSIVAEIELLSAYWRRLPEVVELLTRDLEPRLEEPGFSPGFALPELDAQLRAFLAPARARWLRLSAYQGRRLALLDLATNPATHTTKTFASLMIVARAVEFFRRTGRGVLLVSPTSANKGTALRDAVLRAYDAGLASPETLRVAVIAPYSCRHKLRTSRLTEDPELRRLNPLMLHDGQADEDVKSLAVAFAEQCAQQVLVRTGMYPWFSLDLRNYAIADAARAFFEQDTSPALPGRAHAHAVSSAFGLLGYHLGRRLLEATGQAERASRPSSLLVQHLATPDMVLHLLHGSFDRSGLPRYAPAPGGGWWQDSSPHFPRTTDELHESIDPTFYTHRPATSEAMDDIIAHFGGSGIVVSRRECLDRYAELRELVSGLGHDLPSNPADLREWSLVMALTGTLNALDRDLLPQVSEVVIHGSGWYTDREFTAPGFEETILVRNTEDMLKAVVG